ncbi:MAG: hypothetical protein K0R46_1966, partial [Herbinix sp.]|nr:hypothetical protein [Herbinix sp.]
MIKKLLSLIVVATMVFSLAACGTKESTDVAATDPAASEEKAEEAAPEEAAEEAAEEA